jgi:DNA-binding NtrC family response regulator
MSQALKEEKTMNVLVVDDERPVCQSVEKILNRKGHKVDRALSVAFALDALQGGQSYDLIICDLMMPHAGGLELLKALKDNKMEIPVLIITGYSSIQSAVETTRFGAAGYLPKPFTPDELEQAVDSVLIRGPWKAAEPAQADDVIDVDMPFGANEVARATSPSYVEHLTRSDVPAVDHAPKPKVALDFCSLGQRACKKFVSKGVCQQEECPIVTAENKKKGRAAATTTFVNDPIDVDMPFSATEVAAATSEAYVAALGRSDMPVAGHWGQFAPIANAPKVLVVDDEVVVANSIRKSLTRKGFAVEEAFTCKEAMAKVHGGTYDLVLLDMRMSDGNGLDVLAKIKAHQPNLPVVIVTGYASVDTAVEAIRSGATDYMAKPFTPEELYTMTNRVLRRAVA